MSTDFAKDLADMHSHYGFHEKVDTLSPWQLKLMLQFRNDFIQEEVNELFVSTEEKDADGVVDALIDMIVVAVGTLDLYGVDTHRAWEAVRDANMNKRVGIKANRPNPLGLPDLVKPEGWVAPSHVGNHGMLPEALASMPLACDVERVEMVNK